MSEDTEDVPVAAPPRRGRDENAALEHQPARAGVLGAEDPRPRTGLAGPPLTPVRGGPARTSPPSADPGVDGGTQESPGAGLRRRAGAGPDQDPAGGDAACSAVLPDGSSGEEEREKQRKAWKDAVSRLHADQRRRRSGLRVQPGYQPGGNRREPPEPPVGAA